MYTLPINITVSRPIYPTTSFHFDKNHRTIMIYLLWWKYSGTSYSREAEGLRERMIALRRGGQSNSSETWRKSARQTILFPTR